MFSYTICINQDNQYVYSRPNYAKFMVRAEAEGLQFPCLQDCSTLGA